MFYKLKKGAVDIYYLRIDPESHRARKADVFLNGEELAYYNGCSSIRRKNHFLYGRALVKSVVSWNSGLPINAVHLKKDLYGRLYWEGDYRVKGSGKMDVNLSHAGEMVVCAAILEGKVGIDVESTEKDIYHTGLSFFHRKERAYLSAQRKHHRASAACKLWTMKESYIKCKGKGLAIPLESFNVLEQSDFIIKSFRVEHYCISVTLESGKKNIKTRIREINSNTLLDMNEELIGKVAAELL